MHLRDIHESAESPEAKSVSVSRLLRVGRVQDALKKGSEEQGVEEALLKRRS